MLEVQKFTIPTLPYTVTMPQNSRTLTIKEESDGNTYLYMLVDTANTAKMSKNINGVLTGQDFEAQPKIYITTGMYKGNITHFFEM